MSRMLSILCITTAIGSVANAQELLERGMLATETMSRTRLGGSSFQLGDMMYISVLHPANTGAMYVSSHMEYFAGGNWRPVPTRDDNLGKAYKSGAYPGLRDFVRFEPVSAATEENVCLFMPYEAAALTSGKNYRRRYVIRLWDNANDEIKATYLPEERVDVQTANGKTVITVVKAKACAAKPFTSKGPIPETRRLSGVVRFFNARSGKWVCPGNE